MGADGFSESRSTASGSAGFIQSKGIDLEQRGKEDGLLRSARGVQRQVWYLTQPKGFETPLRILAGFKRVHLVPGQSIHIGFTIAGTAELPK